MLANAPLASPFVREHTRDIRPQHRVVGWSKLPMVSPNPCLECGACCAWFRVSFYWREADLADGGTVPTKLTESLDHFRLCMKGTHHQPVRCVALHGDIGRSVSCSIYDLRPTPCREFAPGDERCAQARASHGLPPLEIGGPGEPIRPRSPDDHDTSPPLRAA